MSTLRLLNEKQVEIPCIAQLVVRRGQLEPGAAECGK
jgi:hypothetical protein